MRPKAGTLPIHRHALELEVEYRPVQGAVGQPGAPMHTDGPVAPKGFHGEAPELGVVIHCQPKADRVATHPDQCGLR